MAYQPKSYKKFVATAATATLVVSAVAPVALAAKPATEFSDVAPQYKEAVDYLVNNSIAAGKTPSTFGTAENIIRVDAAIWIAKATLTEGEISAAPASEFTDVPDRGVIYVDALKSKGYVNGTSDTSYNSYANISRGEVALILAEAYGIEGNTADNKFTDVNSRYLAAVSALKDNGITAGKTSTSFGTGDAITRGELAIWVHRLETLGEVSVANVNVAVDGSKATVTADVKNAEENADATVSVYPNGNLSATPIVNSAKVVNGKVTSAFNEVPAGTHTVVVKVGEVSSSKSFTIAAALTPKVESVTAINAKEVRVSFNQAMLEGLSANGAELLTNYTVSGGKEITAATLSDDGKSVTLTLGTALDNNTAYTVTVKKNIENENGEDLGASDYVTSLFFADTVKPTVSGVTSKADGSIEVNFSEKIAISSNDSLVLYINGQQVAFTPLTVDSSKVVVSKAALAVANLEAGKTYGVIADGAKDLANPENTMDLYTGSFTYNPITDTTAPTLKSLTAKDEDTLTLTFSEALMSLSGSEVEVYKGETKLVTTINEDPSGQTSKYSVDLAGVYAAGESTASLRVVVKAYKDTSGNFGVNTTQNITVNKDTVKPTFVSSTVDSTNSEFEINFNETLASGVPLATNFTVTDSNGVLYPVTTEANVDKTVVLDSTGYAPGTYTVQVAANTVTDTSQAKNGNVAFSTTFVKAAASSDDTTKPTVSFGSTANKGEILATFSEQVKAGNGAGSATLLSNYKLNGAALPTGTVITLAPGQLVATITLPTGTLSTTKANLVTASNVQDLAGNVLTTTTQVVTLTENTKPKLTSAAYQANGTLKFTFSEDVITDGTIATTDEDDFAITVAGNELLPANYTIATGTEDNEVIVTPAASFSFATGTITVETAEVTTIADAAGNTLTSATVVNVVR